MASAAIKQYFESTGNREIRDDLIFAIANVAEPKVAVDCGCGAGADINHLVSKGFTVYGFDVEEDAIMRCTARFKHVERVNLTVASFSSYNFPDASLVVADASLFFCPPAEFPYVWNKIYECLFSNGIFCGSFLGPEDTMASPDYNPEDYWPEVAVFEKSAVMKLFAQYEILRFNEYKSTGTTSLGEPHNWHIYSVVARKANSL